MKTRYLIVAILAFAITTGCKKNKKDAGVTPTPPPAADAAATPEPTASADAAAAGGGRRIEGGFATPESVLHDTGADLYYVSNINGSPGDKDDNGFISKLGPDGQISDLKWIDGAKPDVTLNAPKGSALWEGVLYVADIDTVRMFDVATGAPKGEVAIKGASFLNDVVAHKGKIFVTDTGIAFGKDGMKETGTDAIWVINQGGNAAVVAQGKDLAHPNGLAIDGDRLVMVAFGGKAIVAMTADAGAGPSTKLGELPTGQLDGVAIEDGKIVVTSWECSCVYTGPLAGPYTRLAENLPAPADLGWDGKRQQLLIPLFQNNAIAVVSTAVAK